MKRTAKAIIFNNSGKVLILKTRSKGEWDLPGGNLKDGETIEECLFREVMEETRLTVKKSFLLGASKFEGKLRHLFTAITKGKIRPTLSKEHVEYKWVHAHRIPQNTKPKLKRLLSECNGTKSKKKVVKLKTKKKIRAKKSSGILLKFAA